MERCGRMSKTLKNKIKILEAHSQSSVDRSCVKQAQKATGFLVDISRLPEDLTEEQRTEAENALIKKYGFKPDSEGVVHLI